MAKLFPPYIEGTIPAFYANSDGTASIAVPYTMNRGVSPSEVTGFSLKIKTVQSSTYLYTGQVSVTPGFLPEIVYFTIPADIVSIMNIGQFYKIQLAYKSGDDVGQYSTVGIIKFTTCPIIDIQGLSLNYVNNNLYTYTGTYSQDLEEGDITERVYTYKFDLYNANGELIETSGDQIHNSSNDTTENESYDTYKLLTGFSDEDEYYLSYSVITQNGLQLTTPKFLIQNNFYINPEINADLIAILNYDNGYIQINLQEKENEGEENATANGMFLLSRGYKTSEKKYVWERLINFNLIEEVPNKMIYKDFTIEQGKTYIYSIQQYNQYGLYSTRLLSNEIYADFEDMFLYDGERQLKIKFNPKVSSFKNDILEQKMDTIGSKYPFFFRNGRVKYKEFPISGLISYYMDEESLFKPNNPIERDEATHNLVGENFYNERDFKLEVLEWLNNGKPKLFRSLGEGNYIVRLMNISLSPNDIVARMLHSFSATAYEIADYNFENLLANNIIKNVDQLRTSIQTKELKYQEVEINVKLNEFPVNEIWINGVKSSYDKFNLTLSTGEVLTIKTNYGQELHLNNISIEEIKCVYKSSSENSEDYFVKFNYNIVQNVNFSNYIKDIKTTIIPWAQIIGKNSALRLRLTYQDLNPLIKIKTIYSLKAKQREIDSTYCPTSSPAVITLPDDSELDRFTLYKHYVSTTDNEKIIKYYDPNCSRDWNNDDIPSNTVIKINGEEYLVTSNATHIITKPVDIKNNNFLLPHRAVTELSYKCLEIDYDITPIEDYDYENLGITVKQAQQNYFTTPNLINYQLYGRRVKEGFKSIGVTLL